MELLTTARENLRKARLQVAGGDSKAAYTYYEEAERHLRQAVTLEPEEAEIRLLYAQVLDELQRDDEAEFQYEEATQLAPNDERIAGSYVQFQQKRRQQEESEMIDNDAVTTDYLAELPADTSEESEHPYLNEVEEFPQTTSPSVMADDQTAYHHWVMGEFHVRRAGDGEEGEKEFRQALALQPDFQPALKSLTHLLLDQARFQEAEEYLIQWAALDSVAAGVSLENPSLDSHPTLFALQATLAEQQENLIAAEAFLRRALMAEPTRVDWNLRYARLLEKLARRHDAMDWLDQALSRSVDAGPLHQEYARLASNDRRYDLVEKHLQKALEINPQDPGTLYLQASLEDKLRRYKAANMRRALAWIRLEDSLTDEAESLYLEALSYDAEHLPTLKDYAAFLQNQNRFEDAEKQLAVIVEIAPAEAEVSLQTILKLRGDNPETLNHLARVYFGLVRLEEAEHYLRRALDGWPDHIGSLELLTELLEKQNHSHEAEQLLEGHPALLKQSAQLKLRYAQLLAARRAFRQAQTYYKEARALAPDDENIQVAYEQILSRMSNFEAADRAYAEGWIAAEAGNLVEAQQGYVRALAIDPEHVDALKDYARLLEGQEQVFQAYEYIARLAQFDPEAAETHYTSQLATTSNAATHCAYGWLLQELGHPIKARQQFKLALAQDAALPQALAPYVNLLLDEGEVREAEMALSRALAENDSLAQAHWLYATLLLQRHRYDLVGKHLSAAAHHSQHDPRYTIADADMLEKMEQAKQAELSWAMACSLRRDGDLAEAETYFRQALDQSPDFVPALLQYSELLFEQERHEEARYYLQEVSKLDPYELRADQLLAAIAESGQIAQQPEETPAADSFPVLLMTDTDAEVTPASTVDELAESVA